MSGVYSRCIICCRWIVLVSIENFKFIHTKLDFGTEYDDCKTVILCIISPMNHVLYAIAGMTAKDFKVSTDSVEHIQTMDIHSNAWNYTTTGLRLPLVATRSVSYESYIYIIGGQYHNANDTKIVSDMVHIIHTATNDVMLLDEARLPTPVSYTTPVVIGDVLYVFGGYI
eukprot:658510_1